jgi:hypothetical protein
MFIGSAFPPVQLIVMSATCSVVPSARTKTGVEVALLHVAGPGFVTTEKLCVIGVAAV